MTTAIHPIFADAYRTRRDSSYSSIFKSFFLNRNFRALFTLRLYQSIGDRSRLLKFVMRALHRLTTAWAGIDLPAETRIGPGLAITHGWGMVISPGARIGSNVTIFHGATLGRADRIDHENQRTIEYPIIEDCVWIGPHAVIVGGVTVGTGARILANAFVTSDVPAHSMVSGNPARVIKTDCAPDVWNKFEP